MPSLSFQSLQFNVFSFLSPEDSYYILSLRITSETFTEDLKDETSSKFKTLKANITGEVSNCILSVLGCKIVHETGLNKYCHGGN